MYSQRKDNLVLKLAQMFVSFGWVGGGGIKGIDYPPTTQTLYPPSPTPPPSSDTQIFPSLRKKLPTANLHSPILTRLTHHRGPRSS